MTLRILHWPQFLLAFVLAPLVVTALTFWAVIPIYALIFGGPAYVAIGLPVLAVYLRRHPPEYMPIILLALACVGVLVAFSFLVGAMFFDWPVMEPLPPMLSVSAVFAVLWSGFFALFYRRLIRDL